MPTKLSIAALSFTLLLSATALNAQTTSATASSLPVFKPWQSIREADITEKTRVWRSVSKGMDARTFMANTGNNTLTDVLLTAVRNGQINAYNPVNDRFTERISAEAVISMLDGCTLLNRSGGKEQCLSPESIGAAVSKLLIKEDELTVAGSPAKQVRIVGIAPVVLVADKQGNIMEKTLFWVYYPDSREYLSTQQSVVSSVSWGAYFEDRMFNSIILKQLETRSRK